MSCLQFLQSQLHLISNNKKRIRDEYSDEVEQPPKKQLKLTDKFNDQISTILYNTYITYHEPEVVSFYKCITHDFKSGVIDKYKYTNLIVNKIFEIMESSNNQQDISYLLCNILGYQEEIK